MSTVSKDKGVLVTSLERGGGGQLRALQNTQDKIKRFFECTVPVSACNIKCSYCYIIQENRRNKKMESDSLNMDIFQKSVVQERLGGICYFSLCGAGETTLYSGLTDVVKALLEAGHYVNITTNGTITKKIDELLALDSHLLKRLHFSFSFHYCELKRKNLIDTFFANIKQAKKCGCSFVVQLNLCDEYLPYLDEIKRLCLANTGAYPQVAVTRDESSQITLLTTLSREDYMKYGQSFASPLFDFSMRNFLVKRKEFCYAGDWSCKLILGTGELKKCYDSGASQNFYDLETPLKFEAIGTGCSSPYCVNSTHFLSFGVIPELKGPTYAQLRNRLCADQTSWYSQEMEAFLGSKLIDSNQEYSSFKKARVILKGGLLNTRNSAMRKLRGALSDRQAAFLKKLLHK